MTTEEILDVIAKMTVLEVSELVKAMEDKFGVTAAAPAVMAAAPVGGDAAEEEAEQTEFTVKLTGFGDGKKISVIKEVRSITGLGLKEAKELVEGDSGIVKESVSKDDAKAIKEKLEAAGAAVEMV